MTDESLLWFTYDEAAERLGVKKASVQRMARAKKWPRRTGNDGKARIGLSPDRLADNQAGNVALSPPPDHSARIIVAEARAEELAKQVQDLRAERDRLLAIIERQASARPVETIQPMLKTAWWRRFFPAS